MVRPADGAAKIPPSAPQGWFKAHFDLRALGVKSVFQQRPSGRGSRGYEAWPWLGAQVPGAEVQGGVRPCLSPGMSASRPAPPQSQHRRIRPDPSRPARARARPGQARVRGDRTEASSEARPWLGLGAGCGEAERGAPMPEPRHERISPRAAAEPAPADPSRPVPSRPALASAGQARPGQARVTTEPRRPRKSAPNNVDDPGLTRRTDPRASTAGHPRGGHETRLAPL